MPILQLNSTIARLEFIRFHRRFPHFRLFSTFKLTHHEVSNGRIVQLAFDRPASRNAISRQMNDEFHDYISNLVNNDPELADIRVLILTSSHPEVFCAGADLKERRSFTALDTSQFLSKLNHTLDLISDRVAIPTISAIQGKALGGGLEIALSTDFRVFGNSSLVSLPETRLAIIPGAGGTHRLPKLIGYSKALELMVTGRPVAGSEALKIGIANQLVDDADEGALVLARKICEGGPLAIKTVKQAVKGQSHSSERSAYASVVNSKDKFEALEAFAAKRKPVFRGE